MSIYDKGVMFHIRRRHGLRWKQAYPSLTDLKATDWLYALLFAFAFLAATEGLVYADSLAVQEEANNWKAISVALMNEEPIESDDGQWAGKCGYFQEATND